MQATTALPVLLPAGLNHGTVGELEQGEQAWVRIFAFDVDMEHRVWIDQRACTRNESKDDYDIEVRRTEHGVATTIPDRYTMARGYDPITPLHLPVVAITVVEGE